MTNQVLWWWLCPLSAPLPLLTHPAARETQLPSSNSHYLSKPRNSCERLLYLSSFLSFSFSHIRSMAPAKSHFSNRLDSFRSLQLLFSLPEMSPFSFAFQQISSASFQLQVRCYLLCNPWMASINSRCRASHIGFFFQLIN